MAEPGKKAELDKDGLSYDFGKAELDKEGMSFSDTTGAKKESPAQESTEEKSPEAQPVVASKRRLIIYGSIAFGVMLVLIIAGIVTYKLTREEPVPQIVQAVKSEPPQNLDSVQGEIALDPFLVLFKPSSSKQSGVLFAQVTLQVNPEIAYNIGSRMFDIRNLIYQRLSANAEVYSNYELAAILREDLKPLNVKDVNFTQFDKR